MRIEQLQSSTANDRARISALMVWEDSDRPPLEVFFETGQRFANSLICNPDAFLAAAIVPALWAGERRIHIEEAVCPLLLENLGNAVALLLYWHKAFRQPIRIEAPARTAPANLPERHAGVFLSGGLDSLFTLRDNRQRYPREHPLSIHYGILVHGFDMGYMPGKDDSSAFEQARKTLAPIVEETGIVLVPLVTNLRQLNNDIDFWAHQFHGAALSAVAHSLGGMLDRIYIASSPAANIRFTPWGSHPLLDTLYSSCDVQVVHHGMQYTRLEKTAVVAEWPAGRDNLRVCLKNRPEKLNCGCCEKCVRTRLMLLLCGRLEACKAFDCGDVTAEQLQHLNTEDPETIHLYDTLREPLAALGRDDLAAAAAGVARRSERYLAWRDNTGGGVKARFKRLDKRYLGGKLFDTYSRLFP